MAPVNAKTNKAKCSREGCGKLLTPTKGPGRPRRFCSGKCENREWQRLHPRRKVAA